MQFHSLDDIRRVCRDLPGGDEASAKAAAARQDQLTKPLGSLGRLETLAVWLARWQRRAMPRLDTVNIVVFAGNHGVTAQGVSPYPSDVTMQMVANYAHGGAAINQLATLAQAKLTVVPLDLERPTEDFTLRAAMDEGQFLDAVNAGYGAVSAPCDLLAIGEMGIGNTTAAAAISAALLGGEAASWVGRGAGVDDRGLRRKQEVVERALARHRGAQGDPLAVAMTLGGRELAAMLGATLAARRQGIPVLLDGFVCTAAVLPLLKIDADALSHCQAAHVSAEAGHRALLAAMKLAPLFDLGMRLGEASGAGLAIQVLRAAVACHAGMATFAEAGVAGRSA